jgi:predicted transcriptional regulator
MSFGRKSKIDVILEHLEEIREWKKSGVSDETICKNLGISKPSLYKYMKENKKIRDAFKGGTRIFVGDLRSELARQALKHELITTKIYRKKDLVTGNETEFTETTKKEVDGNLGAIHLLLKNLDRENWSEDWQRYELKKQELELKKQIADEKAF